MAAQSSLVDICACSICLETLENPRTLNCDHSFCKDCLEDHFDPSKNGDGFDCPNCRKFHSLGPNGTVSSIKVSFLVTQMLDIVNSLPECRKILHEGRPCCILSCRKTAFKYCLECKKLYCKQHWQSDHDLSHEKYVCVSYNRQIDSTVMMCEKHDSMIKHFCTRCLVYLCNYCKRYHPYCAVCNVSSLINTIKGPIQQNVTNLSDVIDSYADVIGNCQNAIIESQSVWDDLQEPVQQMKGALIAKFINILNSSEDSIRSCCTELVSKFQEKMKRQIEDCSSFIDKSKAAIEAAGILVKANSDPEFIYEGPTVAGHLESVCAEINKDIIRNPAVPKFKVNFKPAGSNLDLNNPFGSFEICWSEGSTTFDRQIPLQALNDSINSTMDLHGEPALAVDLIKKAFQMSAPEALGEQCSKLSSLKVEDDIEDGKSDSHESNIYQENNGLLYVSGIKKETTTDELMKYFTEKCKFVVGLRRFPNGSCSVTVDGEAAAALVETRFHDIGASKIEVTYRKKPKRNRRRAKIVQTEGKQTPTKQASQLDVPVDKLVDIDQTEDTQTPNRQPTQQGIPVDRLVDIDQTEDTQTPHKQSTQQGIPVDKLGDVNQAGTCRLFLGGIDDKTTTEEIESYFKKHCKLIGGLKRFPKGGGSLTVDNEDVARQLVETRFHDIGSCRVTVLRSQSRNSPVLPKPVVYGVQVEGTPSVRGRPRQPGSPAHQPREGYQDGSATAELEAEGYAHFQEPLESGDYDEVPHWEGNLNEGSGSHETLNVNPAPRRSDCGPRPRRDRYGQQQLPSGYNTRPPFRGNKQRGRRPSPRMPPPSNRSRQPVQRINRSFSELTLSHGAYPLDMGMEQQQMGLMGSPYFERF